jgi:uncharacterized DUF497 family protein
MSDLRFEWDERKNTQNKRKHGVSFEEAETVFLDDRALLMADPDHSGHEERLVLLGVSAALRMLVVCHCNRASDHLIRLISARKATATEQESYNQRWAR